MKPRSISVMTTSPSFMLPCFFGLVFMMFAPHVLARTDRRFHEVGYRAARMASESQEAHEIDNKVLRATLIHRDHPDSPLSPGNTTTVSERFAAAAKRSIERSRLMARRLASTDSESPVELLDGEFVMSITLGTPGQTFTTIMDTGSALVWVQCTPCVQCYKQNDALFDPSASTSYSVSSCDDALCSSFQDYTCTPNCHYTYGYGGGSTTVGDLARDVITLTDSSGSSTAVSGFAFGCSNDNKGFDSSVDGLVGLNQGPLSLSSQLGQIYTNVFSYCLVSYTQSTTSSSDLTFGSTASTTNGLVPTYVPMVDTGSGDGFYYVPMVGITINGNDVGLSASSFQYDPNTGSGGVIVDSGTTLTLLSSDAYNTVVQTLQNAISDYQQVNGQTDLCYDVSGVDNPTFPTMAFQFTGNDSSTIEQFQISDSSLFFPSATNTRCLAMASASNGPGIIGYIHQADNLFIFDNVNQQIGWAQTTC